MKKLILLYLPALLFSCSSPETKETTAEPVAEAAPEGCVKPKLGQIITASPTQTKVFYLVHGFNPKSKACWDYLRANAKGGDVDGAVVINFVDAESFTPKADGSFGSESIRKKVVAQWVLNEAAGVDMFSADPYGYGTYVEPK